MFLAISLQLPSYNNTAFLQQYAVYALNTTTFVFNSLTTLFLFLRPLPPVSTRREPRIMLISAFAFVFCYFFPKKRMWTNATNATKRQGLERLERSKNGSFEWETKLFNFFFEKFKKIKTKIICFLAFLAFERDKRDVVVVVVTFVPQSFMWRCGRSFHWTPATVVVVVVVFVPQSFLWRCGHSFPCSHSKRLQRVVHRTPTNDNNES